MSPSPVFTQSFVQQGRHEVVDRLPAAVRVEGVHLLLDLPAAPVLRAPEPLGVSGVWEGAAAGGPARLEIQAVADQTVELSLRLDPPAGRWRRWRAGGQLERMAEQILMALRSTIEDRPLPMLAATERRSPRMGMVAAVVVVVALAGVAGVLFAGPRTTPVTATLATERYRTQSETPSAGQDEVPRPPRAGESEQMAPPVAPVPSSAEGDGEAGSAEAPAPSSSPTPTPDDAGSRPRAAASQPAPTSAAPPAQASDAGSASEASAPPERPFSGQPEPGVYRYETSGWEELSVPGSRRALPDETAQSVLATDCGFRTVWQPIEERTDELVFCVGGGVHALSEVVSSREFYGHRNEEHFTCEPAATSPSGWSTRCHSAGTRMKVQTRIGPERSVEVGGEVVRAVRVVSESVLEGTTSGSRSSDSWVEAATGLLLRSTVTGELTTQGPAGSVRYREDHRRELLSLEPTR